MRNSKTFLIIFISVLSLVLIFTLFNQYQENQRQKQFFEKYYDYSVMKMEGTTENALMVLEDINDRGNITKADIATLEHLYLFLNVQSKELNLLSRNIQNFKYEQGVSDSFWSISDYFTRLKKYTPIEIKSDTELSKQLYWVLSTSEDVEKILSNEESTTKEKLVNLSRRMEGTFAETENTLKINVK